MSTYYVSSGSGNNSNSGTSPTAAFATLQQAANVAQAGDTVKVESGTYTNPGATFAVVLSHSGTAGAPITFEADDGAHPVLDSSGNLEGFRIEGSYITLKGFEVKGDEQSVNASTPDGNAAEGSGIIICGAGVGSGIATHDVIENNTVHDEPGGGIANNSSADYVSVLNNTVYDNGWYSRWGSSGISLFGLMNSDSNTSAYKNVVAGNVLYGNKQLTPSTAIGSNKVTDGNGIIVDSLDQKGYAGKTLVENNVSYNNGANGVGTGMHEFDSSNVSFLYNTAYDNASSLGQIVADGGSNNVIENNIEVAAAGQTVDRAPSGGVEDYNVLAGGGSIGAKAAHDIAADPRFVNAGAGNFQLQSGSPAIGAANSAYPASTDIAGAPRPAAGADIGAYEHQQGSTPAPTSAPTPATTPNDTLAVGLGEDYYHGDAQATISIDGKTLGTETVTAHQSSGKPQVFTFSGDWGAGSHTVAIEFMNDAYGGSPSTDRNLYLDSLTFDGTQYSSATISGPYTSPHGAGSLPISLHCQHDTATFSIGTQSS